MRGGGGGNPQQGQSDQATNFFWLLVIFFSVVVAMWLLCRQYLVGPIYWFRIHEIDFMNVLVNGYNELAAYFHLKPVVLSGLDHLRDYMQHVNLKQVQQHDFIYANTVVGDALRYPVIGFLLLAAGMLLFLYRPSRFRQTYNMENLKKLESKNWPEIMPVMSIDLVKEDLNKGPWAMSKLPLDFCKENNLIFVKEKEERLVWGIYRGPAYRAFAMQMGQLWRGVDKLPIHIKALYCVFVARAAKETKASRALLRQISVSAKQGKLDFSGVEEAFKKYGNHGVIRWLEKRHAYVYTVMASLLEIARSDGVLATAEFLWLKPVDRRLWYMLNNVGRQVAFVEVAGPYAHWLAEKRLKRAIRLPMVKQAVLALEQEMEATLHVPETEKWHSAV